VIWRWRFWVGKVVAIFHRAVVAALTLDLGDEIERRRLPGLRAGRRKNPPEEEGVQCNSVLLSFGAIDDNGDPGRGLPLFGRRSQDMSQQLGILRDDESFAHEHRFDLVLKRTTSPACALSARRIVLSCAGMEKPLEL
jgi:hypothetical protein